MTPIELMYKEYKAIRKSENARYMSAHQAFLWARGRIVKRCRNQLLGEDDPRRPENVRDALQDLMSVHFQYHGYDCTLAIENDEEIIDDDCRGYTIRHSWCTIDHEGWGRDGMDFGEYKTSDTIVEFNETRQDILPYAPKGTSKQVAYEWATEMMQGRLESYESRMADDLRSYGVIIECNALGIHEALWGVEIDVTDAASEEYLEDVVDEIYDQFVYEFDRLKKIA